MDAVVPDFNGLSKVVMTLKVDGLRRVLEELELPKTGLKSTLQNRILDAARNNGVLFTRIVSTVYRAAGLIQSATPSPPPGAATPGADPGGGSTNERTPSVDRMSARGGVQQPQHQHQHQQQQQQQQHVPKFRLSFSGMPSTPQAAVAPSGRLSVGGAGPDERRSGSHGKHNLIDFVPSPFYKIRKLLAPAVYTAANRCPISISFNIDGSSASKIAAKTHAVMFFVGPSNQRPFSMMYPEASYVFCNNKGITGFAGLKKKPHTCKPANLTSDLAPNGKNNLLLRYICPPQPYITAVQLVELVSVDSLIAHLKTTRRWSRQQVLNTRRASNSEDDIETMLEQVTLKDPISKARISIPARSTNCKHIQCFDCRMFLDLNYQVPTWECPICNRAATFWTLIIDGYFEDILQQAGDVEFVEVTPDGEWKVPVTGISGAQQPLAKPSAAPEAGDDILVIEDEEDSAENHATIKTDADSPSSAAPSAAGRGQGLSSASPPPKLARRQNGGAQHPVPTVIDLTLSDSEDESEDTQESSNENDAAAATTAPVSMAATKRVAFG
ncbi:E3 SUMO-protein ligase pli1 [Polyrhizophydium stewartii]|uniref:E3 SUMO-protein ligase pli1 n=1 Tax=Polyrhizophydium stewartii TaxID=2732419 RepID=A0ABR4NCY8_9FUNG